MTANVGHILALMLCVGSVAVMDARLLGAFAATPPGQMVRLAGRSAALGLAAEASHVATNARVSDQRGPDRAWDFERALGGLAVARCGCEHGGARLLPRLARLDCGARQIAYF